MFGIRRVSLRRLLIIAVLVPTGLYWRAVLALESGHT